MGRRRASVVLALCTLVFFIVMVVWSVINLVVQNHAVAFAVSNGIMQLALSGMWLVYATTQFPNGVLCDRFGERKVIPTAVGGTAATSLLLTNIPNSRVFCEGPSGNRRRPALQCRHLLAGLLLRRHRVAERCPRRWGTARQPTRPPSLQP